MEQRAYGLLLFELIERHDGSTPAALTAVRAVAEQAAAAEPVRRPGFSKLVAALDAAADVNDTESAGGRRGRVVLQGDGRERRRRHGVLPGVGHFSCLSYMRASLVAGRRWCLQLAAGVQAGLRIAGARCCRFNAII